MNGWFRADRIGWPGLHLRRRPASARKPSSIVVHRVYRTSGEVIDGAVSHDRLALYWGVAGERRLLHLEDVIERLSGWWYGPIPEAPE